jgi:hypothetical protein
MHGRQGSRRQPARGKLILFIERHPLRVLGYLEILEHGIFGAIRRKV